MTTKIKLMILPITFFAILIISSATFYNLNSYSELQSKLATKTDIVVQDVLKGRISVYQFLRSPSLEKANKVRNDFKYVQEEVQSIIPLLEDENNRKLSQEIIQLSKEYILFFDNFASLRINDFNNGIEKESSNIGAIISKMAKAGGVLEVKLNELNQEMISYSNQSKSELYTFLIVLAVLASIIFVIVSLVISKRITSSIEDFENGLLGFFSFINNQSSNVDLLDESSKDEFGFMAKLVNENITKTKEKIEQDQNLIDEAKKVIEQVKKGVYTNTVTSSTSNESLNAFKDDVNSMIQVTKSHFNSMELVLEEYSKYNYTSKLSLSGVEVGGEFDTLSKDINKLRDSINEMLVENKSNGLTLDKSSITLLNNVNLLNKNSNEAAAALEETAASLEEISGNISSTTNNVVKMSGYANDLSSSANEGQSLANQTTTSMDEINEEVTAISEAITIIDQIAFQTNILSLNAAVEAATAGEAGKGFAVVAQEVRNLAARSSEAAKEIKDIVENATSKANKGKEIAGKMIEGYNGLNENISKTTEIIKEIESASKEQLVGINQVNDAINSLDKQTQQNASIASQTNSVATQTDSIAKLVVSNANEKEFIGKDSVEAKEIGA